jgi:hypothetical protein
MKLKMAVVGVVAISMKICSLYHALSHVFIGAYPGMT